MFCLEIQTAFCFRKSPPHPQDRPLRIKLPLCIHAEFEKFPSMPLKTIFLPQRANFRHDAFCAGSFHFLTFSPQSFLSPSRRRTLRKISPTPAVSCQVLFSPVSVSGPGIESPASGLRFLIFDLRSLTSTFAPLKRTAAAAPKHSFVPETARSSSQPDGSSAPRSFQKCRHFRLENSVSGNPRLHKVPALTFIRQNENEHIKRKTVEILTDFHWISAMFRFG